MSTWLGFLVCLPLAFVGVTLLHADEFNSNGVKIHYVVKGRGDPVILVHGLYASAMLNWQLPGTVAELAKHYRVIAFDNRGHRQSGKPEAEDQYGIQMVEDVVRLMDHLQLRQAHVVGYSLGGMITMKLLTLHPERVRSAVLGGMGWFKADSPLQHAWEGHKGHGSSVVPAACVRAISKLAVTETEVKAVRVPVTIIVGERDPCRQKHVEPLRRIRPDWPLHVLDNANHVSCIGRPEFKAQIELSINRCSSSPKPRP